MNAVLPLFSDTTKAEKASNIIAAAKAFAPQLAKARVLDRKFVSNTMTLCFGGSDAEGFWTWRDAYDAIELALVLHIRRLAPQIGRVEDAPADIAAMLANLTDLTLTHTRRSEEQVELDQFSTPPALAVLAVAAAQVRPGDLVCEPSAGTGLLAICAEACGATLELNELSAHRASLLDGVFQASSRTRHDAAQLPNLLRSSGSFHAVVTNPPFKQLEAHLKAAIDLLADGGRLSAIVPSSAFEDADLLRTLSSRGEIVGLLTFPGRAFAKHGTSVETGLIVLDRKPGGAPCTDKPSHFETIAEVGAAISALRPRPTAQARSFREVNATALLNVRAREIAAPSSKLAFLAQAAPVAYDVVPWSGEGHDVGLYQAYRLGRIAFPKSNAHPSDLVESASMASIAPPAPSYRPHLPPAIVDQGGISDAQMEQVIYAGEAHARMLPGWWVLGDNPADVRCVPEGTPGAFQLRCGYFIGDGTGCGKGREGAAIIADNIAQGRPKAVWLTKNDTLLEDARRDWRALGGSPTDITPQSAWRQRDVIKMDRGILFSTYATLRQPARGVYKSRLDQIVEWLGPDFDGVIVCDEAHGMANAAGGGEGSRGAKKPSMQGQAGLALQNRLPLARVVYVSATGATVPQNLAYASRLGLWGGPEAPFNTRADFLEACDKGGVAIMELVARELKAMGLYLARSLSFEGVEYDPLRHELTPDDIAIWDTWADAFQIIHTNLSAALEAIGIVDDEGKTVSSTHKSAILSAFEGSKLRFFNHLLAGIKCPTLVAAIRTDLEAGNSAVVQIVSTNEAVQERRLAEIPPEEWNNLSIDLTPKEYVLDYLRSAFPVTAMIEIKDDDGNVTLEPLRGSSGEPVYCQRALALRDALLEDLACLPAVPSVLDALIHTFGTDGVAEITGRSRRVVLRDGRRVVERRGSNSNRVETDLFMDGKKRILIFSDAGGTGRGYHAARTRQNQQRRHHYLVEPGWRADNAVQGLGRTHRTDQASAPLFRPVTTNIQGEKRFTSIIARRLDSLGALTRGERRTAGNGLFSASDNLESVWAYRALRALYSNIVWGEAKCMNLIDFVNKTALRITDTDGCLLESDKLPPMNTFLNRVLALRIADQNAIFEDFTAILESILNRAAEKGDLDRGVEDITATDVEIIGDEVIRTDPVNGAETRLMTVNVRTPRDLMTADDADAWTCGDPTSRRFVVNKRSGAAAIVQYGHVITDDKDRMSAAVRLFRPHRTETATLVAFEESSWHEAPEAIWRATWDAEISRTDPYVTRQIALVTGLLLPVWSKLPDHNAFVRRLKAPDGRRWLGRVLDIEAVPKLRADLGLTDVASIASDGAHVMTMVMDGRSELELSGDLWLKKSKVMDNYRLEVVNGVRYRHELRTFGAFIEIINHQARVFITRPDVLSKVLAKWPALRIVDQKAAA